MPLTPTLDAVTSRKSYTDIFASSAPAPAPANGASHGAAEAGGSKRVIDLRAFDSAVKPAPAPAGEDGKSGEAWRDVGSVGASPADAATTRATASASASGIFAGIADVIGMSSTTATAGSS